MASTSILIQRHREKLINAIIYFAENTQHCYKTKLIKLLYFLDFLHYKEVGRSVTGLKYQAWERGPVSPELFEEIENPHHDMKEAILFKSEPFTTTNEGEQYKVNILSLKSFDLSPFSKREFRIMKEVAETYRDKHAEEMVQATHELDLPWHRVYNEEKNGFGEIPYDYILEGEEKKAVQELAKEHNEVVRNYS